MKKYTLPFDVTTYNPSEEGILIDMSKLSFDVSEEQQKRSSFIFLRNAGIEVDLDFSNCSYEDKEQFLLLYLTEDIDVNADILSTTWIEILSAKDGGGIILPSILTSDEIDRFLKNNKEFVAEIYQLINSLPVYSLYCSQHNGVEFTTDEFKRSDSHLIKITNFSKLSKYDAFILLIDGATEPLFYEKLFIKGEYYISYMMNRMPFLNLLSALFMTPEMQSEIANRFNEVLTPQE